MSVISRLFRTLRSTDPGSADDFVPYTLPHPHKYPFEMDLARVVGPERIDAAIQQQSYSCYLLGDVGGINDPRPQQAVADALCALTPDARDYDPTGRPCGETLFAYIAGDIVYNRGEAAHYAEQFYAPYRHYDRPIFAIPGNHDGDGALHPSLEGFAANFCAPHPGPAPDGYGRGVIDQPNVYWTLEAPWLRIVGLYTNVPEGGVVDEEQRQWFLDQIARPRDGKHLVVALHQPVFSLDRAHGGSRAMLDVVHEPARRAGCRLVVSGHAHNYQRFAYDDVTYLVNGGGGYYELHDLVANASRQEIRPLVAHTRSHSFMHMTVTPAELQLCTVAVPLPFDAQTARPSVVDEFTLLLYPSITSHGQAHEAGLREVTIGRERL